MAQLVLLGLQKQKSGPRDSVSKLQALAFIANFTGLRIYRSTLLNASVMPFTERTEEERPILNAYKQHHYRGWDP